MIGAFSREAKNVKDNEAEVNEHHDQNNAGLAASMRFGTRSLYDKHTRQSAAKHQTQWPPFTPRIRSLIALRLTSIEKIKAFTNQRDRCFNQLLLEELGSAQKPIPRLSKFFLNLAFSTRQKRERRHFCCDGCWRKRHSSSATNFARDVVNKMGAEL